MFKNKEKLLWKIFFFILFLSVIQIIGLLMGVQLDELYPIFKLIFLGVPIILIILHSFITLSPMRGIFFLLLAAALGFTSEYFGLKYGQFFGTFYTYSPQITVFTVPLQVLFYWAVFIYTGYWTAKINYFKKSSAGKAGDLSKVLSAKRIRYSNEKWGSNFLGDTRNKLVASESAVIVSFAITHVAIIF